MYDGDIFAVLGGIVNILLWPRLSALISSPGIVSFWGMLILCDFTSFIPADAVLVRLEILPIHGFRIRIPTLEGHFSSRNIVG